MTKTLFPLVSLACAFMGSAAAQTVGGADSCVAPQILPGTGTFSFDMTSASTGTEGQHESACSILGFSGIADDVWFAWTAPSTGIARLSTCGLSAVDTKLAVYAGGACPTGPAIVCDDDGCAYPSRNSSVEFNCTIGTTFVFQIGIYAGSGPTTQKLPATPGIGQFAIDVFPIPANDDCSQPVQVVGSGPFPFDSTWASTGAQGQTESLCALSSLISIEDDVWFTWTAPFTGHALVSTCGQTHVVTKMAVYEGSGCPTGPAIGCDDRSCALFNARADFACTAGHTYSFQIGSPHFSATGGTGTFTIERIEVPNDDCTSPVVLTGTGPFPFENRYATTGAQGQTQVQCSSGTGPAIPFDLWYTWTATFQGTASVQTCTLTRVDTEIAVYNGAGCPGSSALACNNHTCIQPGSSVDFQAVVGQTYTIQLGGIDYASWVGGTYPAQARGGTGSFVIVEGVPPSNDDCANPLFIPGIPPTPFNSTYATTGTQGQNDALCMGPPPGPFTFDLWFAWSATQSGFASVSTRGFTTVNTILSVYDGAGCPTAPALVCVDDVMGPNPAFPPGFNAQSLAQFPCTAGQGYTIHLGSVVEAGTGEISVVQVIPPSNDDCSTPIAIHGDGRYFFDDIWATTGSQGQTLSSCGYLTTLPNDIWFDWTSPGDGQATFSTCGELLYMGAAVYEGGGCPQAPAISCSGGACIYGGDLVSWPVSCGAIYAIQIGNSPISGLDYGGQGYFTIETIHESCSVGTPICSGDGSGTACPCGNVGAPGNGCAHSMNAAGATLAGTGSPSVSGDSFLLLGSGLPNSFALYFQGTTALNNGNGSIFGDGLRCPGGQIVRLGTELNVAGVSQYPAAGQQHVASRGMVPAGGGDRTYQCWYRNAAAGFCSPALFNLTNGLRVHWVP